MEAEIELQHDDIHGYTLVLRMAGQTVERKPAAGVTDEMIQSIQLAITSAHEALGLVWQGQEAEEVEDPALAMAIRETCQRLSEHLLHLFEI